MPKKTKKVSKDSDDEYEVEDPDMDEDVDEIDEDEVVDDDDDSDEEKEDLVDDGEITSGCMIDEAIEGDDEYFDNDEETEIPTENSSEYVSKENRVSSNRMTKYEMVRILGERTKQLNMGAKPLIKNYKGLSYDTIAEKEFVLNMIPYKIKRPLPNGKFEIWALDELKKDHLLSQLE